MEDDPEQKKTKKTHKRHNVKDRELRYEDEESEEYTDRITDLVLAMNSAFDRRRIAWWSKCCFAFITPDQDIATRHPAASMIEIKKFFEENHIHNREALEDYLRQNLPRDENDHILLPQINSRHPMEVMVKSETTRGSSTPTKIEPENPQEPPKSVMEGLLRDEVARLENENRDVKAENFALKVKIQSLEKELKAERSEVMCIDEMRKNLNDLLTEKTKNYELLDLIATELANEVTNLRSQLASQTTIIDETKASKVELTKELEEVDDSSRLKTDALKQLIKEIKESIPKINLEKRPSLSQAVSNAEGIVFPMLGQLSKAKSNVLSQKINEMIKKQFN